MCQANRSRIAKLFPAAAFLVLLGSGLISTAPVQGANTNDTALVADGATNSPPDGTDISREALELTRFEIAFLAEDDSEAERQDDMSSVMKDIGDVEKDYLDKLQKRRSSYGLYAVGGYDNDFQNSEDRYEAGFKWKLFNDGYFEAVQDDEKKILQTQLEFYQLRRDMTERQLDDYLFQLFLVDNQLNVRHFREKRDALAALLQKRSEQLKYGYTTELDVLDVRHQLRNAESSLSFYSGRSQSGISEEHMANLNRLDTADLKPLPELIEMAKTSSYELKIQDNFIERADYLPGWRDDVALDLNAEYTHEYYGEERSVVGVSVEIPLTFDPHASSLIKTQKRIYQYQQQAVAYRLQQKLEKLYDAFVFHKHRLLSKQEDIEILLRKTQKALDEESNIIQKLSSDPARDLDLLVIQKIDAKYDALDIRLKIYETVIQIAAITQADKLSSLFQFD